MSEESRSWDNVPVKFTTEDEFEYIVTNDSVKTTKDNNVLLNLDGRKISYIDQHTKDKLLDDDYDDDYGDDDYGEKNIIMIKSVTLYDIYFQTTTDYEFTGSLIPAQGLYPFTFDYNKKTLELKNEDYGKRIEYLNIKSDEPSRKKRKIGDIPKYAFSENPMLDVSDTINIKTNRTYAVKNNTPLFAKGCNICIAFIIVAKMDNDEIWHGIHHCSDVGTIEELNRGFRIVTDTTEHKSNSRIQHANYYLVTSPEFLVKRKEDVLKSEYSTAVVYSTSDKVTQLNDSLSLKELGSNVAGIDVKLSNGLIEARYYACVHDDTEDEDLHGYDSRGIFHLEPGGEYPSKYCK